MYPAAESKIVKKNMDVVLMDKRLNRKRSVTREDNNIYIHKLNPSLCVSDFIRMMYDGLLRGY